MFQYRLVLSRLRRGDTDREIARSKSMGRRKLAALRALAEQHGWLDPDAPLPDDAAIAAALGQPKRAATTVSSLQALRPLMADWLEQGVSGTTIHAALKRNHGYQDPAFAQSLQDEAITLFINGEPTMSNISAVFAAITRALRVEVHTQVVMT